GSAASVWQLLNAKPDLGEGDLGGEERLAGLGGNKPGHNGIRPRPAQLRDHVGVEEPSPHKPTSRTGDLTVSRSMVTSPSREVASAATMSRPEIGCSKRSNSSARTITTASRPCSVTRCGPRCCACRTTSLNCALASCRRQRLPGCTLTGLLRVLVGILLVIRV